MSQKQAELDTIPTFTRPGVEFNTGFDTASLAVRKEMSILTERMQDLFGINLREVSDTRDITAETARERFSRMHDTAALLDFAWQKARVDKNKDAEFAAARLFNKVTLSARGLHETHKLVDTSHLTTLKSELRAAALEDAQLRKVDPTMKYDHLPAAKALEKAARVRTHELAWAWVVKPTMPRQHYGRITLESVPTEDQDYNIFITQPTFLDQEFTDPHTHLRNLALSRPLGPSIAGTNKHTNLLLESHSRDNAFPLKRLPDEQGGRVDYDATDVVVIPTRTIHGIFGSRVKNSQIVPTLEELAQLPPTDLQTVIAQNRFGETSSLHLYIPDPSLTRALAETELLKGDPKAPEWDMIVFHQGTANGEKPYIWTGGGGAWSLRQTTCGSSGEHCGVCWQEEDPRRIHLDDTEIWDRFIEHSEADRTLIAYQAQGENLRRLSFDTPV